MIGAAAGVTAYSLALVWDIDGEAAAAAAAMAQQQAHEAAELSVVD